MTPSTVAVATPSGGPAALPKQHLFPTPRGASGRPPGDGYATQAGLADEDGTRARARLAGMGPRRRGPAGHRGIPTGAPAVGARGRSGTSASIRGRRRSLRIVRAALGLALFGCATLTALSGTARAQDTMAPMISKATVASNGTTVSVEFDEAIASTTEILPAAVRNALSITVDGVTYTVTRASLSSLDGEARVLVLRFADNPTINVDQRVVVAYNKTTAGTNALKDSADNEVQSFTTGQDGVPAVENGSTQGTDATPPMLLRVAVASNGTTVSVEFHEAIASNTEVLPAAVRNALSITVDGVAYTVTRASLSSLDGENRVLVLRFANNPAIKVDQRVVVAYNKTTAGTNAMKDSADNEVQSFTTGQDGVPAVENDSTQTDTTPPTLESAEASFDG